MRIISFVPALIVCLLCISCSLFAQTKTGELEAAKALSKSNQCAGYYLQKEKGYRVNQQLGDKIVRHQYNAAYQLTGSYEVSTSDYTLNLDFASTPVFSADLQLGDKVYEVYVDKKRIWVIEPDFAAKKDSVVFKHSRSDQEADEKRLAVIPHEKGLRILTFSNKRDKLFLYNWKGEAGTDTMEFSLPEITMTPEEIKKYSKDVKVKYKPAFQNLLVERANSNTIVAYPGENYLYYDADKIWLVLQTYLATGVHVLTLDMASGGVSTANFFVNDIYKNHLAKVEMYRTPYALIWKNHLIIRNTSNYFFQYQFYDLATNQLVKEYTAGADDSFKQLINSDLNQRGTWLSGGDEKKLDNEKAFLRKLSSGDGFILLAGESADSVTITCGSLKETKGLAGTLLSAGTAFIGASMNMRIGPVQLVPYLSVYRNKLIYFHSTFSIKDFSLSASRTTITELDKMLDGFERRDIKSKSSFIIAGEKANIMAIFNADSGKFELYSL